MTSKQHRDHALDWGSCEPPAFAHLTRAAEDAARQVRLHDACAQRSRH